MFSKPNRNKRNDKKYLKKQCKKYNPIKADGKLKAIQQQLERRKQKREKRRVDEENKN
jgi:hypothetical protein